MAFKDKYGITAIDQNPELRSVDTFDISWDYDDNEHDLSQRKPVFLIVPDKRKDEHYHVTLSRKGATDLRTWLNKFLRATECRTLERKPDER